MKRYESFQQSQDKTDNGYGTHPRYATPPPPASIEGLGLTIEFEGHLLCHGSRLHRSKWDGGGLSPRQGPMERLQIHNPTFTVKQRIGMLENEERSSEVMTIGQSALFFSGCYVPSWFVLSETKALSKHPNDSCPAPPYSPTYHISDQDPPALPLS